MDIAPAVRAEICGILRARSLAAPEISTSDALSATLGLTSLEIVSLAPRLNAKLGVDPFTGTLAITDIRTVGELVGAYENARSTVAGNAVEGDALRASAKRAEMRRRRPGD